MAYARIPHFSTATRETTQGCEKKLRRVFFKTVMSRCVVI